MTQDLFKEIKIQRSKENDGVREAVSRGNEQSVTPAFHMDSQCPRHPVVTGSLLIW